MPQRRKVFNSTYGTAKTETGKGGANIPPPMATAPVPLPIEAQRNLPPQMQQPSAATQPRQGESLPPGIEELIQQMLMRFGGSRG